MQQTVTFRQYMYTSVCENTQLNIQHFIHADWTSYYQKLRIILWLFTKIYAVYVISSY